MTEFDQAAGGGETCVRCRVRKGSLAGMFLDGYDRRWCWECAQTVLAASPTGAPEQSTVTLRLGPLNELRTVFLNGVELREVRSLQLTGDSDTAGSLAEVTLTVTIGRVRVEQAGARGTTVRVGRPGWGGSATTLEAGLSPVELPEVPAPARPAPTRDVLWEEE